MNNLTDLPHATPPPPCVDDGDTAWIMIATTLVLSMMPGLALFEAGLLRAQTTVSITTQVFGGLSINSVLWFLIGSSLVFGDSQNGIIGDPSSFPLLLRISEDECFPGQTIPKIAFIAFQMMFATITPLLMTGAFCERLLWKAFVPFIVLWEVLIYYPVAHWIWNSEGWLYKLGTRDFAGGIVIHTTAGIGAIVSVLMLGKRKDFLSRHGEYPPSSIPLVCVGGGLLWTGWFGFNAGSTLAAGASAATVVTNTHIASATSSCVWIMIAWIKHKPNVVDVLNGAIAGLAGITPVAGYCNTVESFVIGIILGFAGYFSIELLRFRFKIDDALDVSSVHGVPGIIGSIALGFVANPSVQDDKVGLIHGGSGSSLGAQCLGVLVALVWAGVITAVLMFLLLKLLNNHVVEDDMDKTDHGVDAYRHGNFSSEEEMHGDGSGEALLRKELN